MNFLLCIYKWIMHHYGDAQITEGQMSPSMPCGKQQNQNGSQDLQLEKSTHLGQKLSGHITPSQMSDWFKTGSNITD